MRRHGRMSSKLPDMQSIETYLSEQARRFGGRALIVGKGPSYRELDRSQYADHFIVGLNEVAKQLPCDAAFIIDEDILINGAAPLLANVSGALITPRIMHRRTRSVGDLAIYGPVEPDTLTKNWQSLAGTRHRPFNLATSAPEPQFGDTYPAFNFSAPTLANLLAATGFRQIVLAGVDGGTRYSASFREVEYKKLQSVQNSFDVQFGEFRAIKERHLVRFSSIRCAVPYIMIGAEPEQILAEEVLKWSIDSNSFLTPGYVRGPDLSALYAAGSAGTPFSFQRLYLPQCASHKGRGLYFDSDMLVFRDVYELFNADMGENLLLNCQPTDGRPAQFSVFLVDNHKARWDPEEIVRQFADGELSYEQIMRNFCFAQPKSADLPAEWNSLEVFQPGRTANCHFTDMGTQPWLSTYNPNAAVWCEALFAACEESPVTLSALETSLDKGWVRPSLKWQLDHSKPDPWRMPRSVRQLDRDWLPPHIQIRKSPEPRAFQAFKWRAASSLRRLMMSRSYSRALRAYDAVRKAF